MLRRLTFSALSATLILVFAGCGKKETSAASTGTTAAPSAKKVLRYGTAAEPPDLDPQTVSGAPEHRLIQAFFEGLVSEDPQLNIVPGVAEKWDISPDGLVYTFHLRADAKWSNGEPVTADDFLQSYRRILTPTLAAEYAYMLWHVVGAEDYYRGKLTDFTQTGFKAPDARTLQLTLHNPTPFLLHAMNHQAWYPVPIATVKKFGGLDKKSTAWTTARSS
jgi:oligopeptide transport system substrate-binding protein